MFRFPLCFLSVAALATAAAFATEPVYQNNFEQAAVGETPKELMVLSGAFTVKEEAGNKFLELPGSPLDTFGLLFGPAQQGGASASARFFGTKQGRKFPTFGISLNGVSGYRLQVSPAKKALEIFKGDEAKTSVPFDWQSGAWTNLRIQLRKTDKGAVVEGKAWAADAQEPAEWAIRFDDPEAAAPGRAGVWGSPYSGAPIRFDDLRIEALP